MTPINKIPEFGIKRSHEERRDGGCGVVFDPNSQRYAVGEDQLGGMYRLFSGGVNKGEDIETGVLREVVEESGLNDFLYVEKIAEVLTHYRNELKNVHRVAHATCFLVILKSRQQVTVKLEAHEKFSLIWVTPDEIIKNWKLRNDNKDFDHWFYFFEKSVARVRNLGYGNGKSKPELEDNE